MEILSVVFRFEPDQLTRFDPNVLIEDGVPDMAARPDGEHRSRPGRVPSRDKTGTRPAAERDGVGGAWPSPPIRRERDSIGVHSSLNPQKSPLVGVDVLLQKSSLPPSTSNCLCKLKQSRIRGFEKRE